MNTEQLETVADTAATIIATVQNQHGDLSNVQQRLDDLLTHCINDGVSAKSAGLFVRDVEAACAKLWAICNGEELLPETAVMEIVNFE